MLRLAVPLLLSVHLSNSRAIKGGGSTSLCSREGVHTSTSTCVGSGMSWRLYIGFSLSFKSTRTSAEFSSPTSSCFVPHTMGWIRREMLLFVCCRSKLDPQPEPLRLPRWIPGDDGDSGGKGEPARQTVHIYGRCSTLVFPP